MAVRPYLLIAVLAMACAVTLSALPETYDLPIVGRLPLWPIVALAALVGLPLARLAEARLTDLHQVVIAPRRALVGILGLGALLAVPPILIDLLTRFPAGMNAPLPAALLFCPAIALVAEVAFHLVPLAALAVVLPRTVAPVWLMVPTVFVEPVFQAAFGAGTGVQAALVFANVSLVSAVQLWLFRRYGFAAMYAVRLSFYLFWHILWGTLRLPLLF